MNLKVGANIKELRHRQGITQEKLAEKLGTTPQAVSRWESGVGYPDIELLPHIADAFGVSLDELFGKDAREKEAKIQFYLEECQRLGSLGEEGKRFALMREALEQFPLDHRIMLKYGWAKAPTEESEDSYESIAAICNRVLDDNPADELRYDALSLLGMMYRTMGKTDEAIAVAKRFPKMQSYEFQEMDLLCAYDSESEEYALQLQEMTESCASIGRRNWLFSDTVNGANASAMLYSLVESAKENGLHPFDYLEFVFRTAPGLDIGNLVLSALTCLPRPCPGM